MILLLSQGMNIFIFERNAL